MKLLNQDEIISGLRQHEPSVFLYLQNQNFPAYQNFVLTHGGTHDEANHSFQDGLILLLEAINKESFTIKKSVEALLFTLAKRAWLRDKDYQKKHQHEKIEIEQIISGAIQPDNQFIYQETNLLIDEILKKLNPRCRDFLQLFLNGASPREIASILNIQNRNYFKNLKCKCRKKLRDEILATLGQNK